MINGPRHPRASGPLSYLLYISQGMRHSPQFTHDSEHATLDHSINLKGAVMRLMVGYYNGNEHMIADIHVDDPGLLRPVDVAHDCEDINFVVEVLPGVDYDKAQYNETAGLPRFDYPIMLLK